MTSRLSRAWLIGAHVLPREPRPVRLVGNPTTWMWQHPVLLSHSPTRAFCRRAAPRPLARAFRCIMLECSPITGECFMGNDRPSSSFSRQAQRCPTIPRARAASPPSQRQTRRSLLALRATPCAPRRKSTNLDVTASPPFCHADTPAPLHNVHPPDRNPRCAMLGYSQITGECFT